MLRVCGNKGFQIFLENNLGRFGLSVQFGPMNYCTHYNNTDFRAPHKEENWTSPDAEIGILSVNDGEKSSGLMTVAGDEVHGRIGPKKIVELLAVLSSDHDSLEDMILKLETILVKGG